MRGPGWRRSGGSWRGDGSLAAQRLAAGVPPSGVTSYGLALCVFCSEHAAFTSRQQVVEGARAVLPGFPDAVLALSPQAPYIFGDCAQWDVPPAAPGVAAAVTSDVPALIVSGALDAITAPPNGQAVASGLENATTWCSPTPRTTSCCGRRPAASR